MNALPPMYLINLDRSPDRLKRFKECNGHLENVVRASATDGNKLDRKELIHSGYIDEDLSYLPGALAHLKLWEMAAVQDRSMTIFEDDVVVSHQFEKRALEILKALPDDWDIIQWSCVFNPLYVWIDLGISKTRLECYGSKRYRGAVGHREFQAAEFLPAPVKLLHSFGSQGYTISAKGARAALGYCIPLRNRLIQFPEAAVVTGDNGTDVHCVGYIRR